MKLYQVVLFSLYLYCSAINNVDTLLIYYKDSHEKEETTYNLSECYFFQV